MIQSAIRGIIPPVITPLSDRFDLDREAMERTIEHMVSAGVNGIFLLGSTGEWASLPEALRKEVVRHGTKAAGGRLPVLVNITDTSLHEVKKRAGEAADAGADLAVVAPPFYYAMTRRELESFFELAVEASPLPVLLYNAPQYTRNTIATETILSLSNHDRIVGIKDSSGNIDSLNRWIHALPDNGFSILIGPELLLSKCLSMGCQGGVCGGANLFPGLYCNLFTAYSRGEPELLEQLHMKIRRIHEELYSGSDSALSHVMGLKYLMSRRGLCHPRMAMPVYEPLSPGRKKVMDQLLEDFKAQGY